METRYQNNRLKVAVIILPGVMQIKKEDWCSATFEKEMRKEEMELISNRLRLAVIILSRSASSKKS